MEIYKKYYTYQFIRGQAKNMNSLRKRRLEKSKLIFEKKNIPNSICILNCLKELIPKSEFKSKSNQIITKINVLRIVTKLFNNVPPKQSTINCI